MNWAAYSGYIASALTGLSVLVVGLLFIHFSDRKDRRSRAGSKKSSSLHPTR